MNVEKERNWRQTDRICVKGKRDDHVQCAAGVFGTDKDNRLSKYLRHRMQTAGNARVSVCKGD